MFNGHAGAERQVAATSIGISNKYYGLQRPATTEYWPYKVPLPGHVCTSKRWRMGQKRGRSGERSPLPVVAGPAAFEYVQTRRGASYDDSPGCLSHPHIQLVPEIDESSPANNPRSAVSREGRGFSRESLAGFFGRAAERKGGGKEGSEGRAVKRAAARRLLQNKNRAARRLARFILTNFFQTRYASLFPAFRRRRRPPRPSSDRPTRPSVAGSGVAV